MKTFATGPKAHKGVPQLIHQRFTPSFNLCRSRQMDVSDTASGASLKISSESLRKISFRILSDLTRLMTGRSLVVLNDRENILSALREKPLKVREVMKRANVVNEEACQSLLLKMRDEGLVKFDIHSGRWLMG